MLIGVIEQLCCYILAVSKSDQIVCGFEDLWECSLLRNWTLKNVQNGMKWKETWNESQWGATYYRFHINFIISKMTY